MLRYLTSLAILALSLIVIPSVSNAMFEKFCDMATGALRKGQLALDVPTYSRTKDGDVVALVKDSEGNLEHRSMRETFKDETLLSFVYQHPLMIRYWKVLALVGADLKWSEHQGENGKVLVGQGETLLGTTIFKMPESRTSEGIQIIALHTNESAAEKFRMNIKLASDFTKKTKSDYKVGYQKLTAEKNGATLPGTGLLLFNILGHEANNIFFERLFILQI
jgi:hypothetical protein